MRKSLPLFLLALAALLLTAGCETPYAGSGTTRLPGAMNAGPLPDPTPAPTTPGN